MSAVREAPAAVSEPVAEAPEGRKRLFVGVGVAAGLAVVAGMAWVLMSGGSSDEAIGAPVVRGTPTAGAAAPTATAAPPIKKFTGKNARDPFKALVVEPVAASVAPQTAAPAPSASTSVPVPVVTITQGTSTSTSTTPPRTAAPVTITMVAVASGDTSARLKVNSTSYEVKPLEEFGKYFKLLNLRESTCGAVQYGDVTFDLCEGQSRTFR